MDKIIRESKSAIVAVGPSGFGPWQEEEMHGCLNEFVKRKLPVIPVLLPSARSQPELPFYLSGRTWVDLRGGLTPESLELLVWGITGERGPGGHP